MKSHVLLLLAIVGLVTFRVNVKGQGSGDAGSEFKRAAQELSAARLSGADENAGQLEKALVYLDSSAVSMLNAGPAPDLDAANKRLASLISHTPPIGENYRLVRLGGNPASYAMLVNFGLGGPAAVRIYAAPDGKYALAAKIDHTVQKDFFDSDLELVPVSKTEAVFVTIAGRTDDLSTGVFSAWRFGGRSVIALWSTDLLQQSSYETDEKGFHVAYCSQPDDDHPSDCLKMSRDLFQYQAGEWKRIETADFPPPKPATK